MIVDLPALGGLELISQVLVAKLVQMREVLQQRPSRQKISRIVVVHLLRFLLVGKLPRPENRMDVRFLLPERLLLFFCQRQLVEILI